MIESFSEILHSRCQFHVFLIIGRVLGLQSRAFAVLVYLCLALSHSRRSLAPMTKEEYERQQSVVRRVFDPETGRNRL